VQNCISSVEAKAEPIIEDITETVQKVADLGLKVAGIVATCAPSGESFITAIPCIAAEAIRISSEAADDISRIIEDVKDIRNKAPGLKQELDSCSAEVQSASSNIEQLIQEINKCVEDYTSNAA
jgi:predicted transcriptional regulator